MSHGGDLSYMDSFIICTKKSMSGEKTTNGLKNGEVARPSTMEDFTILPSHTISCRPVLIQHGGREMNFLFPLPITHGDSKTDNSLSSNLLHSLLKVIALHFCAATHLSELQPANQGCQDYG